jgi:hypothetical protein
MTLRITVPETPSEEDRRVVGIPLKSSKTNGVSWLHVGPEEPVISEFIISCFFA